MPYGTVNADVIQTSTTGGVLGAGNASIMKNRLINGSMTIDQRNAGASKTITDTGAITYTLDRWFGYGSAASKFSVQQNAGSVTPPNGFSNYLGVTSLAATTVASGDLYFIGQYLEGFNTSDLGFGTANAKTVTLSFWVRSSLTGTFGGTLENSATNRSYPFTYTITSANTWEYETITIAGDTSGTWIGATSGIGIRVFFGIGVGTTYSGTAGSWAAADYRSATGATSVVGTNGATFYITGVQLEVGSSATGFEYRMYTTELQYCQRYLPAFGLANNNLRLPCAGICATANNAYITVNFPVNTRVAPTGISISSATHFTINVDGIASSSITGIAFTAPSSVNANRINATGATGLTTGQAAFLDITSTSGQLLFTGCEL
jgi:hypothetical protein